MKQFRVELWLEVAQENALCLRQSSGLFRLNVKLCQQKLYRTTFDWALGTSSGVQKALQQQASAATPGASGPAPSVPGKMATEAWVRGGEEGAGLLVRLERPPPTHARTLARSLCGGVGRAGRSEGCLPGNLGQWAESTACWERRARALLHNLAPHSPASLLHPGFSKQKLLGDSWGSRHRGNF